MDDLLNRVFLGNPVQSYLTSLALFLAGVVAVKLAQVTLLPALRRLATRTDTLVDDFLIRRLKKDVSPALYFILFFAAVHRLVLSERVSETIDGALTVAVGFFAIRLAVAVVTFLFDRRWRSAGDSEARTRNLGSLLWLVQAAVWLLGGVFILDNLGFDISALVAGLGIGGIAIALAAQTILGDLFSYFAILFDRPFEIGDFIIVGDVMGNVEHIGVKTTRLRSLSGEQIVVSNRDLTESRVRNYKRMQERRVLFRFGVLYETPVERLERIPAIVREIVEDQADTRFDRAHFVAFGSSSLDYEVVYYVLGPDYNQMVDIQQRINLRLLRELSTLGVEFAYPTQKVFLTHGAASHDRD